jgi:hypothetical protein
MSPYDRKGKKKQQKGKCCLIWDICLLFEETGLRERVVHPVVYILPLPFSIRNKTKKKSKKTWHEDV